MKTEKIRELFENTTLPSFGGEEGCVFHYDAGVREWIRKPTGEYFNPLLEDHWQTFQEGFEAAITACLLIITDEQNLAENNWQCKDGVHIWHKLDELSKEQS
jgi:hypothetical protein